MRSWTSAMRSSLEQGVRKPAAVVRHERVVLAEHREDVEHRLAGVRIVNERPQHPIERFSPPALRRHALRRGKRAGAFHRRPLGNANPGEQPLGLDRKSTRLNSSHGSTSYAVFCLKKK